MANPYAALEVEEPEADAESAADEAEEHGDEIEQPRAEVKSSEVMGGEAMEVDAEGGAPRDESMDADPDGIAGLLAEEADEDMVAGARSEAEGDERPAKVDEE